MSSNSYVLRLCLVVLVVTANVPRIFCAVPRTGDVVRVAASGAVPTPKAVVGDTINMSPGSGRCAAFAQPETGPVAAVAVVGDQNSGVLHIYEQAALPGAGEGDARPLPDVADDALWEYWGNVSMPTDGLGASPTPPFDACALSQEGDTIVGGVPTLDGPGGESRMGGVAVFIRTGGATDGEWAWQQTLQPTGLVTNSRFGKCVAIAGDVLLVTGLDADTDGDANEGSGYDVKAVFKIFDRAGGVGNDFVFTENLFSGSGSPGDSWRSAGCALSDDGRAAAVSRSSADHTLSVNNVGNVQIATRLDGPGTSFESRAVVQPELPVDVSKRDRYVDAEFGASVAFSDLSSDNDMHILVVGAPLLDPDNADGNDGTSQDDGVAIVFDLTGMLDPDYDMVIVPQVAVLKPSDAGQFANCGRQVAIGRDVVLVSAHNEPTQTNNNVGAVYVFVRDSEGTGDLSAFEEVGPVDSPKVVNDANFGRYLAVSRDDRVGIAVVVSDGSPSSVDPFFSTLVLPGAKPRPTAEFLLDLPRDDAEFGATVAIDGFYAVVSAPREGELFVYRTAGIGDAMWMLRARLGGSGISFTGAADVAVSPAEGTSSVIVAAVEASTGAAGSGSIHVYIDDALAPSFPSTPTTSITVPDSTTFPTGVAIAAMADRTVLFAVDSDKSVTVDGRGDVCVYEPTVAGSLDAWTHVMCLQPPSNLRATEFLVFGLDIAVSRDRNAEPLVAVSTERGGGLQPGVLGFPYEGSVHLYAPQPGQSTWSLVRTITSTSAQKGNVRRFGRAIALDGLTLVVGAPRTTTDKGERAGVVEVWHGDVDAGVDGEWTLRATLKDDAALQGGDEFGDVVAIHDGMIAVGIPFSAFGDGSVLVFSVLDDGFGGQWKDWLVRARLTPRHDELTADGFDYEVAEFGAAVAMATDFILVGGPAMQFQTGTLAWQTPGGAYAFQRAHLSVSEASGLSDRALSTTDMFELVGVLSDTTNDQWLFAVELQPGEHALSNVASKPIGAKLLLTSAVASDPAYVYRRETSPSASHSVGAVLTLDGVTESIVKNVKAFTKEKGLLHGGIFRITSTIASPAKLTLVNVELLESSTEERAGAIFMSGPFTEVHMVGSVVRNCTAGSGGAVYALDGSQLSILSSNFTGNTAVSRSGGAIVVIEGATLTIVHGNDPTWFVENNAALDGGAVQVGYLSELFGLGATRAISNTATRNGGAISIDGGEAYVSQLRVESNWAGSNGGGISVVLAGPGALITISNSELLDNEAEMGGAVSAERSTLKFTGTEVASNTAVYGGGVALGPAASALVVTSVVQRNKATLTGGGIVCASCNEVAVERSEVVSNEVGVIGDDQDGEGGGIACTDGGVVKIYGSSLSFNTASRAGGALHLVGCSGEMDGAVSSGDEDDDDGVVPSSVVANSADQLTASFESTLGGGGVYARRRGGAMAFSIGANTEFETNHARFGGHIMSVDDNAIGSGLVIDPNVMFIDDSRDCVEQSAAGCRIFWAGSEPTGVSAIIAAEGFEPELLSGPSWLGSSAARILIDESAPTAAATDSLIGDITLYSVDAYGQLVAGANGATVRTNIVSATGSAAPLLTGATTGEFTGYDDDDGSDTAGIAAITDMLLRAQPGTKVVLSFDVTQPEPTVRVLQPVELTLAIDMCGTGTEVSSNGLSCRECDAGYAQGSLTNETGACKPCTAGFFASQAGFIGCEAVDAGFISSSLSAATSQRQCTPGTYARDGSVCEECGDGEYTDINGATACQECRAGTEEVDHVQCVTCLAHSVSDGTECVQCPVSEEPDRDDLSRCVPCDSGYVRPLDELGCTACPAGTRAVDGACERCPAGRYQDAVGQTDCRDPQPGFVVVYGEGEADGAESAVQCARGTYRFSTDECAECPAGEYTDQAGLSSCSLAPDGYVALNDDDEPHAATHIEACPEGTHAVDGVACEDCERGFVAAEGSKECVECAPGTAWPVGGGATCATCRAGGRAVDYTCIACPAGRYQDQDMQVECRNPGRGSIVTDFADLDYPDAAAFESGRAEDPCPQGTYAAANNTVCIDCAPGTASVGGVDACTECTPGTEAPTWRSGACEPCGAGEVSDGTECAECDAGTEPASDSECTPCDPGFVRQLGEAGCTACPKGTFEEDRLVCRPCETGKYSAVLASTECTEPAPGWIVDNLEDADSASPCPAGTYALQGHACEKCAVGRYAAESGSRACIDCPEGSRALSPDGGATACEECGAGRYVDPTTRTSCIDCPSEGVECANGRLTMLDGYWLPESDDGEYDAVQINAQTTLYRCPSGACVAENGTLKCTEGRTGALCAVCKDNHYVSGEICEECVEGGSALDWLLLCILLVVGIGGSSFMVRRTMLSWKRRNLSEKRAVAVPVGKILINYAQVVALFVNFAQDQWPSSAGGYWSFTSTVTSLPLNSGFMVCTVGSDMDYYTRFLFGALSPLVGLGALLLVAVVGVVYRTSCKRSSMAYADAVASGLDMVRTGTLVISYLLYPTVARFCVRMLDVSALHTSASRCRCRCRSLARVA